MFKQQTLAAAGFEKYGKTTRRATFLAEMERVVPWGPLCALIEPVYPKPGNGGPPVEEALYESVSMRSFVGIDLGREPVPDETTVCKFRHLLEAHELGRGLF